MRWWVLVNPAAGRPGTVTPRVREALERRRLDHEVHETTSREDVSRLVGRGVSAGFRAFVAVGGDGTVGGVADALLRHSWEAPPVLGILPAGSGSDFRRTFGIPGSIEEAADRLVGDGVYRIDAGHVSGPWGDRYFLNSVDAGLAAETARIAGGYPRRIGAIRYTIAFWPALARMRAADIRLAVEGRTYEGPGLTVIAANGQFVGGGMNIAPQASLVDGKLDIQVFAGPRRRAFVLLPRARWGLHLRHPAVTRFEGASFTLESSRPWLAEADGEPLGRGPIRGEVLPGAIDFKL